MDREGGSSCEGLFSPTIHSDNGSVPGKVAKVGHSAQSTHSSGLASWRFWHGRRHGERVVTSRQVFTDSVEYFQLAL